MPVRVAAFNVENLFARPKALATKTWSEGKPVLDAYREVNVLIKKSTYSVGDRERIRKLLIDLDVYTVNKLGAIRRKDTSSPKWAWLRKNKGTFDREPKPKDQDVQIVAQGRADWIGWIELATEPTDEIGTRMTARVIADVDADVLGIVEAEDRPSLVRFNAELLSGRFAHVMLVDGNDERGIDVAILTKDGFEIDSIRSNVDLHDKEGDDPVFSRDCPQYEVRTPKGARLHVLVNHFKSQSGGGGDKRRRQAAAVRGIVGGLTKAGEHVIVMGDLNEGPEAPGTQAPNLAPLFDAGSPLRDCYSLPGFQLGNRPGTYGSCGLRDRFDYVLVSNSLVPAVVGGGVFRKGLWGERITRPTEWETYPEMTRSEEQASDHGAVYLDLNL